ncbi:MAG: DUF692 family protein [Bacillota bacterium]|nr:DUF692 family protein [Bacillota bacterium]
MNIGCNWSNALRYLLEKDAVKIDYVKSGAFGGFDEQFSVMRSMRPVLLHGLGYFENLGIKSTEIIDFNRANELIKRCGSPHYGTHLAIRKSDMHEGMKDEEIYELFCKNIKIFKNNLEVPLLLENSADTPTDRSFFDLYPYNIPEKIRELVIENDVFFLLDISHANLTAKYNGFDIYDYLRKLPLNRVKEIHVNGSGYDNNGLPKDTHESMKKEEYELLKWVLNYTNPDIVILEYTGIDTESNEQVIASLEEQLNNIQNICNFR